MQFDISKRFVRDELPQSPEIEIGEEFIKLAVSGLSYAEGLASFNFHVSYMFPDSLVRRYRTVDEALVLVVNDLNQRDCFATNFKSDAYVPEPGTAMLSNLIEAPAALSPPGPNELAELSGGWINGDLSFAAPLTRASVSMFLYVVLENYVSNVVGIDLGQKEVVYF